jgi:hypothetical protein
VAGIFQCVMCVRSEEKIRKFCTIIQRKTLMRIENKTLTVAGVISALLDVSKWAEMPQLV